MDCTLVNLRLNSASGLLAVHFLHVLWVIFSSKWVLRPAVRECGLVRGCRLYRMDRALQGYLSTWSRRLRNSPRHLVKQRTGHPFECVYIYILEKKRFIYIGMLDFFRVIARIHAGYEIPTLICTKANTWVFGKTQHFWYFSTTRCGEVSADRLSAVI
jgi:hypothetical protein